MQVTWSNRGRVSCTSLGEAAPHQDQPLALVSPISYLSSVTWQGTSSPPTKLPPEDRASASRGALPTAEAAEALGSCCCIKEP